MLRLYIYDKGDFKNGQYAVLPDNVSITIKHVNPIFNVDNGGAFSEKIKLSASDNKHLLGVSEHINAATIYSALHGKRFLLYVSGTPSMYGSVFMDNGCGIEGDTFEIELSGSNTDFDDMIGNMSCRDVQVVPDKPDESDPNYESKMQEYEKEMSALYIGECLTQLSVKKMMKVGCLQVVVHRRDMDSWGINSRSNDNLTPERAQDGGPYGPTDIIEEASYELPSKGLFMFEGANFSKEYKNTSNAKQFWCNVRVCGTRYVPVDSNGDPVDGNNPDVIDDWEETREYMSSDGQTGEGLDNHGVWNIWGMAPSFYVMYFLEKLFKQLGLKYDLSKLMNNEDFKRLAFVNTNPQFDTEENEDSYYANLPILTVRASLSTTGEDIQNKLQNYTNGSSVDLSQFIKFSTSVTKDLTRLSQLEKFFGGFIDGQGVDIEITAGIKKSMNFDHMPDS